MASGPATPRLPPGEEAQSWRKRVSGARAGTQRPGLDRSRRAGRAGEGRAPCPTLLPGAAAPHPALVSSREVSRTERRVPACPSEPDLEVNVGDFGAQDSIGLEEFAFDLPALVTNVSFVY